MGVSVVGRGQQVRFDAGQTMARLVPGQNIMAQLVPGRPLVIADNMHCELTDGDAPGKDDPLHPSDLRRSIWAYATRRTATIPTGGAILVPAEIAPAVISTLLYHRELGLAAEGIRVVGLSGDRETPLTTLIQNNLASLRHALDPDLRGSVISPFIGSTVANELADALGLSIIPRNEPIHFEQLGLTTGGVEAANNKGISLVELRGRGVPVPPGRWIRPDPRTEPDLSALKAEVWSAFDTLRHRYPGPIWVKVARAASGMGVWKVNTPHALAMLLLDPAHSRHATADNPDESRITARRILWQLQQPDYGIRVDADVEAHRFPNIMIWVGTTRDEDRFITASDQMLEKRYPSDTKESVHAGNIGPLPAAEIACYMPTMMIIADWLRELGVHGLNGIDLAVNDETGEFWVLEINARTNGNNGAAFTLLGAPEPPPVWVAANTVKVKPGTTLEEYVAYLKSRADIHNLPVHYDPATGLGIFVLNPHTSPFGKMQIGIGAQNAMHARALLSAATMIRAHG